ncbi:hypothetical protein [Oceanobacillus sp. FSL H7-0719]|uniref:hypothetical protein n=1 Tax=Oceanobacillus sp. FSL H7-0719 TaxID=2954507 RepID=UPI0032488709
MAKMEWKSAEEIESEKNTPKPLSELDKLKQENEMLALAVMELSSFMLEGGK